MMRGYMVFDSGISYFISSKIIELSRTFMGRSGKIACPKEEMVKMKKLLSILKILLPLIIFLVSLWGLSFAYWIYEESAHTSISQFFIFGSGAVISGLIIYFQFRKEVK